MSRVTKASPCWVVRNADGQPWDDEWDGHYDTAGDAQAAIDEIREDIADYSDDNLDAEADGLRLEGVHREMWVASGRRRRAEMESLRPVQLTAACYTIKCSHCGDEPESDYGGTIHWGGDLGGDFDAAAYDFKHVGDEHYCDDCKHEVLCVECGALRGDDGDDGELMCAACVAAEKAQPGPLDVPLFDGATR